MESKHNERWSNLIDHQIDGKHGIAKYFVNILDDDLGHVSVGWSTWCPLSIPSMLQNVVECWPFVDSAHIRSKHHGLGVDHIQMSYIGAVLGYFLDK